MRPCLTSSGFRLALAGVLAALPLLAFAAPAAVFGPPTLCHPLDIGDAASLPWSSPESFGLDPDYDVARTVDDTLAILRASDDTLVHMETLRRATIYLTNAKSGSKSGAKSGEWCGQELARLQAALEADVAATPADSAAKLGLRQLDVGYALATRSQSEGCGSTSDRIALAGKGRSWLEKAAALRPDDGALQLGMALALFDHSRDSAACYAHLDRAVALATDPKGLLRRNLLSTMGGFVGASSYEDLAAKVAAKVQRA